MNQLQYTRILALGHRARHGKDSAVKFLEKAFPGQVRRFAFSTLIYAVARAEFGMTTKDGALLQKVGDIKRGINLDYFVDPVMWGIADWDAEATAPQLAVITDCRFQNEFDRVKAAGGVTARVQRILPDGSLYVDPSRPANHPSEIELADAPWDHSFDVPEGRLDLLRFRILPVARALLGAQPVGPGTV
jgi:hypothetical protein